jgi:hypothetical protein
MLSIGKYSAMIAFEYFRFETWIQQSGFLTTNFEPQSSEGRLTTSATTLKTKTSPVEAQVLSALGEICGTLEQLQKLREKYSIGEGNESTQVGQIANFQIAAQQSPLAMTAISKSTRQRQQKALNRVSFFRRVNFGWALNDDTSDREKFATLIDDLRYWNDNLREILPVSSRVFADALVNVRSLTLSDSPADLEGISDAAHSIDGELYQDISKAANWKVHRLQYRSTRLAQAAYIGTVLRREGFTKISQGKQREVTSYYKSQCRKIAFGLSSDTYFL